jgi:hypothetical protein
MDVFKFSMSRPWFFGGREESPETAPARAKLQACCRTLKALSESAFTTAERYDQMKLLPMWNTLVPGRDRAKTVRQNDAMALGPVWAQSQFLVALGSDEG